MRSGDDITIVGWGSQLGRIMEAAEQAQQLGVSCEVIDLQTIVPWDVDTVARSVNKTGRMIVAHEAPVTCGFGAEILAKVQERCFDRLEAPLGRVCGFDTHFPLVHEEFYIPSASRMRR